MGDFRMGNLSHLNNGMVGRGGGRGRQGHAIAEWCGMYITNGFFIVVFGNGIDGARSKSSETACV